MAKSSRRDALGLLVTGASVLGAQQPPPLMGEPQGRIPPVAELVNTFEVEAIARRKLNAATFTALADNSVTTDRAAFDRITLRPRLMVNTERLDLSLDLFGQRHFAPILSGPASAQQRFHPDAGLAMARGASAAKAALIVSDRAGQPVERIAAEAASAGFWYQAFPGADRGRVGAAIQTGAKAVCLTLTGPSAWGAISAWRRGLGVPLVVKGIANAREARLAIESGAQGIVISTYRGEGAPAAPSISVLPEIVAAAGGRIPILIDGGFRRGADILKALALGASAVLVTRPVLWGLAGYGAPGVQHVLESLQTELARAMAMCGLPNLASIGRTFVRIHRR
jgi:4-hydroxymandelate oxidase